MFKTKLGDFSYRNTHTMNHWTRCTQPSKKKKMQFPREEQMFWLPFGMKDDIAGVKNLYWCWILSNKMAKYNRGEKNPYIIPMIIFFFCSSNHCFFFISSVKPPQAVFQDSLLHFTFPTDVSTMNNYAVPFLKKNMRWFYTPKALSTCNLRTVQSRLAVWT